MVPHNPMPQPTPAIRLLSALSLALAMLLVGGCASNRLPRIDPTGQQLLLWPDQPTPPITAPPGATAPTLVPGATAALPPTPPNVVAPPVYTDPFLPGGPDTTTSTDWLGRPVVVGPPVASSTGQPVAGAVGMPSVPGEAISITPSRILAPVGSEVILIGGVCAENGHLRVNERIEWMLDRAGTGQIVTVGARGELDMFRLPQNTPRKIDNYFAITATSPYRDCLDRGTPDPNDDVQIRRGDAWITVSSPAEGTSYVTAYAPDVPNWAGRTARATIYWIDAQWAFPPSVTLAPGQSHTLTTTVTRQSDGAPICGWIVKYTVAGNAAGLGYGGGQTSDVTTDAQGRASVQISPTDERGGQTNVQIEIIRPEQAGMAASPRVTLATGAASISWADGGISGTPLPTTTPPSLEPTPITPPPSGSWVPPNTPAPSPSPTPQPEPEPTPTEGQPDLRLEVTQTSPGPFRVGDTIEFQVNISNQGNGTARNVRVRDDFDVGLTNDIAPAGQQYLVGEEAFDLAPQEEADMPLTFRITAAGRLSHNVTVTADNALKAEERSFFNVEGTSGGIGGGLVEPQLRVTMLGPERHTVGETAVFKVVLSNPGSVPAINVVISPEFDPELKPINASGGYDAALWNSTGELRWQIAQLDPSQEIVQEIHCQCTTPAASTCGAVEVTADGLTQLVYHQKCMEIRSQLGGDFVAPPLDGGTGQGTSPPPTSATLFRIDSSVINNPLQRGDRFVVTARVTNASPRPQRNVRVKVLIPPVLQADYSQVKSSQPSHTEPWGPEFGTGLLVDPIAELPPGGSYQIAIPMTAATQGSGKLYVGVTSDEIPVDQDETVAQDIQVLGM